MDPESLREPRVDAKNCAPQPSFRVAGRALKAGAEDELDMRIRRWLAALPA